jgi:hypothetical protein
MTDDFFQADSTALRTTRNIMIHPHRSRKESSNSSQTRKLIPAVRPASAALYKNGLSQRQRTRPTQEADRHEPKSNRAFRRCDQPSTAKKS